MPIGKVGNFGSQPACASFGSKPVIALRRVFVRLRATAEGGRSNFAPATRMLLAG
jgi:hypothetical protein